METVFKIFLSIQSVEDIFFSLWAFINGSIYKKNRILLLYSSINQEDRMETSHLSSILAGIQKAFTRNHTKISPNSRLTPTETPQTNIKSEFSQSIERKIQIVRSKITEAIEKAGKVADNECLTSI